MRAVYKAALFLFDRKVPRRQIWCLAPSGHRGAWHLLEKWFAAMPEHNLSALKPLLLVLAEPPYTIEPASPSERKRIEKRVKEYRENPASFVPFKG